MPAAPEQQRASVAILQPNRTLALLEALASMEVGSSHKAQTTELHARWRKLEPKGPDRAIILSSPRPLAGAQALVGQAPPGKLEEELSESTEALSTQ